MDKTNLTTVKISNTHNYWTKENKYAVYKSIIKEKYNVIRALHFNYKYCTQTKKRKVRGATQYKENNKKSCFQKPQIYYNDI